MKNRVILGTIMAMGVTLSTSSHAVIMFDLDGPGGVHAPRPLASFDWAPGNFLAVDAVTPQVVDGGPTDDPFAADTTDFTGFLQAEMTTAVFGGGSQDVTEGAGGPFEITMAVRVNEEVISTSDPDGDGFFEQVSFGHVGGTISIYFDDFSGGTFDANGFTDNIGDVNGAYQDGVLIFQGNVIPQLLGANFTVSDETIIEDLDQFVNAPTTPGDTVIGFGASNLDFDVTFVDPDFFSDWPVITSLLVSNLSLPFNSVNPETNILGNIPNFGPVNGGPADPFSNDLIFQADGNQSFTTEEVPEPASLALIGLGLAGFGLFGRRKRLSHS